MKKINIVGNRYGAITVIGEVGRSKKGLLLYKYRCDCGSERIVTADSIRRSKSCGCTNKGSSTHGGTKTKAYKSWISMKARCRDVNNSAYGGRGISFCNRWLKFENFLEDMGPPPFGTSLDRLDNNKGYSKSNCRWATSAQQGENRRNTILLTLDGETKSLTAWAKKIGTSPSALHHRIVLLKLPPEIALTVPFSRSNSFNKFIVP